MYFSLIFISIHPSIARWLSPCIPFDVLLCIFLNLSVSLCIAHSIDNESSNTWEISNQYTHTHSATINKHLNTQSRFEQRTDTHTHARSHTNTVPYTQSNHECTIAYLLLVLRLRWFDSVSEINSMLWYMKMLCVYVCPPAYVCYCVFVFVFSWHSLLVIWPHNRLYVQLMWAQFRKRARASPHT